jgi:dienelactone hydrolase
MIMFKSVCLFTFFLLAYSFSYCQSELKETYDFDNWPTVGTPLISNNGRFVGYTVKDNKNKLSTLIVKSTLSNWDLKVLNVTDGQFCFSENSQKIIFLKDDGVLVIYDLRKKTSIEIAHVRSFKAFNEGIKRWVIFWLKESGGSVVALDLRTDQRSEFFNTSDVYMNKEQSQLLINSAESHFCLLQKFNLKTGQRKLVWKAGKIRNIVTDDSLNHVAFEQIVDTDDKEHSVVLHWSELKNAVDSLHANALDSNFKVGRIERFSKDGSRIFFQATQQNMDTFEEPKAASVDIWNYKDDRIQSEQLLEVNESRSYGFVYDRRLRKIFAIEDTEYVAWDINDEFALVQSRFKHDRRTYLISTRTGERQKIEGLSKSMLYSDFPFWISPSLNYVVYFNPVLQGYFSYHVKTKKTLNITGTIKDSWNRYYSSQQRGIAGWLGNEDTLLLYGRYDVWKIDLSAKLPPVCLTNHYGQKNNIVFSLNVNKDRVTKVIKHSGDMIATAFDSENKRNGFFRISANYKKDPELLMMNDCIYDLYECAAPGYLGESGTFIPTRSLYANIYLVRRESNNEFGNYYVTSDFKIYKKLSNVHPESDYSWYKTSLHTWKSLKGNQVKGILYMPGDFDSTKIYPIIFCYYNWMSDGLNAYIKPDYLYSGCYINVPLYISREYLIAAIDKLNETEITGEDIVSSVVSGANYFSKKSYVDSLRMGLNGYSHGGYETYQLITESNLFAAANSGGGYSDLISGSGSLTHYGSWSAHLAIVVESGGHTLWNRPDIYIKNSPVVNANRITTPLLIMHNKLDGAVDFSQGVEMYSSLKYLSKPVWMLQYDGEDHGVFNPVNVKDYSTRQMQFFDHYLKNKPAPVWMTTGVPAKYKKIKSGLDLDVHGKCSDLCNICNH